MQAFFCENNPKTYKTLNISLYLISAIIKNCMRAKIKGKTLAAKQNSLKV